MTFEMEIYHFLWQKRLCLEYLRHFPQNENPIFKLKNKI